MKTWPGLALLAALAWATTAAAAPFATLFPKSTHAFSPQAVAMLERLDYKQGTITLPGGKARIETGTQFYYLDPADSAIVLTEFWGNPPPEHTLGMLFPAGATPLSPDSWAIDIAYDETGHISDSDAAHYDYGKLLKQMQQATQAHNAERRKNGYASIDLVGWAAPPHYLPKTHQLYWAKRLRFGDSDTETLNYAIRILGRQGVLNLNVIADMGQLAEVEAALPRVLQAVAFTAGNTYDAFDPNSDKRAAMDLGGLISGGSLAHAGLLLTVVLFAKKLWFLALIPILGLKRLIARFRES